MNALVQPVIMMQSAQPVAESLLASRAMLARLSISLWTARRLDKRITDEVNTAHGAAADAGRYNKLLVSKHSLADIVRISNEARTIHYKRTAPWLDDGARILSSVGYLAYTAELAKLKGEFAAAVDKFCDSYPDFVQDARLRLNGLFAESDYPKAEQIKARFSFDIGILPCPTASDFRVDIADAQAAAIRADIEARTAKALSDAMRDIWQRVAERVGHMVEKLRAFKPGTGNGNRAENVFRDSLVANVQELVDLLPSLNITNDSALSAIADRMRRELCQESPDALRDNTQARETVATAAEQILADVSEYLA
jgi:hypothetical protein